MLNHKDIVADLESPESPRTAPGILVEALARRRHLGISPFTVLSCDNMSDNGARTRLAVLTLAARRDPELAAWICFQAGCSLGGTAFHVDDPMAAELARLYHTHVDTRSRVEAFLRSGCHFPTHAGTP